jgi:hypothetical protein
MNRRDLLTGLGLSLSALRAAGATEPLHLLHRVTAAAPVRAPLDAVDLAAWVFHITSDEYVRCAPQHHGSAQASLPDGRRVFISVETIGGSFMAHHYVANLATRDHVRAVSPASQLWSTGVGPIAMRVTWDLRIEPAPGDACRLVCEVLVETADASLAARAAQRPPNVPNPVEAHVTLETPMFAADLEGKALRLLYRR